MGGGEIWPSDIVAPGDGLKEAQQLPIRPVKILDARKIQRIFKCSEQRMLDLGKTTTAKVLHAFWLRSVHDEHLKELITAMLTQSATPEQMNEFGRHMREVKKEVKADLVSWLRRERELRRLTPFLQRWERTVHAALASKRSFSTPESQQSTTDFGCQCEGAVDEKTGTGHTGALCTHPALPKSGASVTSLPASFAADCTLDSAD